MTKFIVNQANIENVRDIKHIADANRESLGFLPRQKVEEVISESRVMVLRNASASIIGFVIYRHRKTDKQTTLSDICIQEEWRGQGGGRLLIQYLYNECLVFDRDFIQLKCPVDLASNNFYKRLGFYEYQVEEGKKRQLSVWRLQIDGLKVF